MLQTSFDTSRAYRYVRYARMSTESQNARSPEQQFESIDVELKRAALPWVHVHDYRDDAKSGRLLRNRPGYCEMLNDIRTERIAVDLILVDSLERFARTDDVASIRRDLQAKHGVLILTADSRFQDPTSVAGKALGAVEAIRATTEGEVKAHNVFRGKRDAAQRRRWPGGPAPIGSKLKSIMRPGSDPAEVDHRVLVPNPETAPVPQRMYALARTEGWGGFRIAKHLANDVEFVKKFGRFSGSTVNFILSNPIYKGVLRFNRCSTGIVADRRVTVRNEPDELIMVDNFCEPIVDRETWDFVQEQRRERSERMRRQRAAKRDSNGKQLRPTAPGVVLRYPLTGLVRCSLCDSSMRPSKAGGAEYYYYGCPAFTDGRCTNRRKIRGDLLWEIIVARIRESLFPLPNGDQDSPPNWLAELISEIRGELSRRAVKKQDARPLLKREIDELESKTAGWIETLSNAALSLEVRRRIEGRFETAVERQKSLESQLQALGRAGEQIDALFKPQAAIDALRQLHKVLESANPTEVNLELAKHLECIIVHPDGRVILRSSRLGLFEGAEELLTPATSSSGVRAQSSGPNPNVRPRQHLLTRRTCIDISRDGADWGPAPAVDRIELPARWLHEEPIDLVGRQCWARSHAAEVGRKRAENGWSQARLAEHFGKSIPTIRHALKIAAENSGGK